MDSKNQTVKSDDRSQFIQSQKDASPASKSPRQKSSMSPHNTSKDRSKDRSPRSPDKTLDKTMDRLMPPEKKMDLLVPPEKLLDKSMEQKSPLRSPLRSPTMRKSKSRSPIRSPIVTQKSIRRKTMNVPNLARKSFLNPRNQREDVTGTMLSNEINMFGHKSSVAGSEANSGGTKFGSRSFRGVNFDALGET